MELRVLIADGLILALAVVALLVPLILWLRTMRARRRRRRYRRYNDERPYFSNATLPRSSQSSARKPGHIAADPDPADGPAKRPASDETTGTS